MFRLKYLSVVLFVAAMAGVVIVACKKDNEPDPKAEGIAAGNEMCDCVASYTAPISPSHPASPLPPEGFNPQNPDLTDPATYAYVTDPGIQAYFAAMEVFYVDFQIYAGKLYECIGVIAKYEKYVIPDLEAYDEQSTEPLLSVFKFSNEQFKNGFKEGVASCSDAFNALWALMAYQ